MANYALVPYPSAVSLTEIERKLPLQFSGHTMSLISLVRKIKVDEADHLTPFELRVSFAGSFGIYNALHYFTILSVTLTFISSYVTSSRVHERHQGSVFVIV
jgi:hypothetical protein